MTISEENNNIAFKFDELISLLIDISDPESDEAKEVVFAIKQIVGNQRGKIEMLTNQKIKLEEEIKELQKYVEDLKKRDKAREKQLDEIQKQIERREAYDESSTIVITADDIIKSFVERLGTLQERVEAKRVMADIFGESGAWVEARNKLTDSGYFREEHPHLPISYKGSKLVELKFFDRTMYVTVEEQQQLRLLLRNAEGMIDTQEDSSWFCIYAAYRYVKGKLGTKGAYTDFFSDVEALLPDVLTKINPAESGDKRYSPYTQMLGRVVSKWFVDDGKLPPLNNLLFSNVKCSKEQFDSYSLIIKNLWRDFKKLEDQIKQEK
jgi:hypothetical protein